MAYILYNPVGQWAFFDQAAVLPRFVNHKFDSYRGHGGEFGCKTVNYVSRAADIACETG